MNGYETGIFIADGSLIYVPVGFKPDRVDVFELTSGPFHQIFHGILEDSGVSAALSDIEGIQYGDGGVGTLLADGAGLATYDAGEERPNIYNWVLSTTTLTLKQDTSETTTVTARTATAHGTYILPSAGALTVDGLAADRSLVAECVTASGNTAATEFAWGVAIGEQMADGDNVWEIVNAASLRVGYQGFRIAGALMTDGDYHVYDAWKADQVRVLGDVVSWVDGVNEAVR